MELADVTLREGDQMPGRSYTATQKIDAARTLDELGLTYIQPGFPATGEKDQSVISELAGTTNADIIALARALESDVDVAIDANTDIVEIFVPVSDRHLDHLLGKSREEMLSMVSATVDYIRDRGAVPHVTLADAFRTGIPDLIDVFETIPSTPMVTLADSVGARTPTTVRETLSNLADHVDIDRVGVHFHNDLGCATANTLEAYQAGVAKADVSLNALGERAGNSPLEEVVVACTVDDDDDLGLDTESLIPICRAALADIDEPYNSRKAVLGDEISKHESGIHTAAMLSDPATLEPFDPSRFGGGRTLLFGSSTGKDGARKVLERAGVQADEAAVASFTALLGDEGPLELDAALALAEERFTPEND